MRIVCIGPTHPYKGGISHYNTLLYQTLSKKNTCKLISWKRRFPQFLYKQEQLDKASKKKIQADAKFILDCCNPWTWFKAFWEVRKFNADLVIFHWVTPFMAPIFSKIAFLIRHFTHAKVLLVCHNVMPHEKRILDRILDKCFFSQVDYFIVHSKQDLEELKSLKKNANARLGFHALYDMFNTGRVNIKKVRKELGLTKPTMLFFGYVRPYKGLKYLLEAMALVLKKQDIELLVVGEFWGPREEYDNLIRDLGIGDSVKIVDQYVPNEEVGKYFHASDVVVLPYTSGTQSGIIQAAYGFDKPVIVSNVGGFAEAVVEGKTGYVVEPENPKALAAGIIKFFKKSKRENFEKNVSIEKKRFSWDNYVQLVYDFFD